MSNIIESFDSKEMFLFVSNLNTKVKRWMSEHSGLWHFTFNSILMVTDYMTLATSADIW